MLIAHVDAIVGMRRSLSLVRGEAPGGLGGGSGFGGAGLGGDMTRVRSLGGERITSLVADPLVAGRLYVATRTRCWQVDGADIAGAGGAQAATGDWAEGRDGSVVAAA